MSLMMARHELGEFSRSLTLISNVTSATKLDAGAVSVVFILVAAQNMRQ